MTEDDDDIDLYEEEVDPKTLVIYECKYKEREYNNDRVPEGFTNATCPLDLSPTSTLQWDIESPSHKVVYDLDFGLFGPLWKGFSHEGFFQSCQFALKHFVEAVQPEPQAVIFARLTLPVPDTCIEYLKLLATTLPSTISKYLLVEASSAQDPLDFALELRRKRWHPFIIAVQNSPFTTEHMTWQLGCRTSGFIGKKIAPKIPPKIPPIEEFCPKWGFLLPASGPLDFRDPMKRFVEKRTQFKVIEEEQLTSEWDGIDELYISHLPYLNTTLRALAGFKAAGGHVTLIDQNMS